MGIKDTSGQMLVKALEKQGYVVTRQKGSHIRLTISTKDSDKHITIPAHKPLKLGTISSILKEVSEHFGITKDALIIRLKL